MSVDETGNEVRDHPRHLAEAVDCPACGAPAGYPCNAAAEGEARSEPHDARIEMATTMMASMLRLHEALAAFFAATMVPLMSVIPRAHAAMRPLLERMEREKP